MAAEKSNIQKSVNVKAAKEDCLSCRLIGGTSLLLASGYVFYRGKQAKLRSTKVVSLAFGSSLGYTGIARLLNIYPFDIKSNTEA
ncbi:hypothetical protein X975_02893, partial [Stegodyphus mimosarum]